MNMNLPEHRPGRPMAMCRYASIGIPLRMCECLYASSTFRSKDARYHTYACSILAILANSWETFA